MSAGLRQRRKQHDGDEDTQRTKPRITLESFDIYQKVRDKEDQVQTTHGATVSLVAVVVCAILVLSELYGYLVPRQREHMVVDPIVEDRLRINFDITFHALTCAEAAIDAMDVAGEQQNGLDHDIQKIRLAPDGTPIGNAFADRIKEEAEKHGQESPLPANYCGPCYGAETRPGQCCNTCDDVRSAYADKGWDVTAVTKDSEQCQREHRNPSTLAKPGEGCRVSGFLRVNKVAGNFHVAMGETHTRGAGHVHQFNPTQLAHYNVSHTIHALSFGEPYPGMKNPLDGIQRMVHEGSGVWMYYLKVIPTVYLPHGGSYSPPKPQSIKSARSSAAQAADTTIWRSYDAISTATENDHIHMPHAVNPTGSGAAGLPSGALKTNQYSVTSQYRAAMLFGQRMNVLPGVFFVYDVSPFMVTVTRHTTSVPQLLTSLFAILGGVLTLASVIDGGIHMASKLLKPQGRAALAAALAGVTSPLAGGSSGSVLAGKGSSSSSSSLGAPSGAAAAFAAASSTSSSTTSGGPSYLQARPAALSAGPQTGVGMGMGYQPGGSPHAHTGTGTGAMFTGVSQPIPTSAPAALAASAQGFGGQGQGPFVTSTNEHIPADASGGYSSAAPASVAAFAPYGAGPQTGPQAGAAAFTGISQPVASGVPVAPQFFGISGLTGPSIGMGGGGGSKAAGKAE